jgi:sugar phosphate permease
MRNSPVYYGWFVLAASAVSEMLVQGATSYASGLFVLPLQAEFHISRAAANLPVLILFAGAMLIAPLVGRALDARSIRLVMPLGAILLGVSFAAIAAIHSLLVMALILFFPAAIAYMAAGPLNTSTLASRWFYRRRGLAQGLAAVATSGGGFIVVPLLSIAIQRHGWRPALFYEGAIVSTLIVALALLVLRDRPSDMGLQDHPENHGRSANAGARSHLRWTDILSSRAFWIPCLTLAAVSGTGQAIVISLVPYGVQLGMTPVAAALPISIFAIVAALTKVSAGLLADRINQRCLLIVAALSMTLSWLALSFFAVPAALFAAAGLAGIAAGCVLPTSAGLVAGNFGSAHFGQVMGWGYALTAALLLSSVIFAGVMFDKTGSYHIPFLSFTVLLAGVSLLVMTVAPARKTSAS